MLFGDGCLEQGVTRELALAAARAGVDDVEIAFELGGSGKAASQHELYRAVREATGAPPDAFLAQTKVPWPSPDNPPQNWQATDLDALWESPIVGSSGTTVGDAVTEALQPGQELPRRLESLGDGITDSLRLPPIPGLRPWLGRNASEAYRRGFVERLAADPKAAVCASVAEVGSRADGGRDARRAGGLAPAFSNRWRGRLAPYK